MATTRHASDPLLAISPFRDWIIERSTTFARQESFADGISSIREVSLENVSRRGLGLLAKECRVSERTLRRYVEGFEKRKSGTIRDIEHVPLQTVDKCLSNEGSTFLWELYPELGH
jgi:hypothetical protein